MESIVQLPDFTGTAIHEAPVRLPFAASEQPLLDLSHIVPLAGACIVPRVSRLQICKAVKPAITEEWSVMDVAKDAAPAGWTEVFTDATAEMEMISKCLDDCVAEGKTFLPLRCNLFTAFELTPLHKVRVVIVGQDPYHTIGNDGLPIAQGLSFSVRRGDAVPPSLRSIYKEISDNDPSFVVPSHGDLSGWASQGVLMLNSCLTVEPNQPGSHSKFLLWMPFIVKVLNAIAKVRPKCIFLLWGREAQKIAPQIGEKSIVLEAAHPSPLSASRGFFGCRHFSQVNKLLASDPGGPIKW